MIDRPAFIYCFAADLQGCGTQRISLPLASLVDAGVADGRIDMMPPSVEVMAAAAPDTIVWQRQIEDSQIETMRKYREALPGVLFVYELDDYIGEIPEKSFHRGFMPPKLAEKLAAGLAICDRVTTSTEPLAEWLRELGGKDVRVVGNALPVARLLPRERHPANKVRVGFAGGISHEGDLDILRLAMEQIGEEVDWVFFGAKPRNPPVRIEFHDGVPPMAYLDHLTKLNLDLVLAPLENNRFNICKSNLRLLEAASAGAAVIAQKLTPYTEGDPAVFMHAETPEDWVTGIRAFMLLSPHGRQKSAEGLRQWVVKHHTLEGRLKDRLAAWTKPEVPWRPVQHRLSMEKVVVASQIAPDMDFLRHARHYGSLDEACRMARDLGADVLWLRPGTKTNRATWDSMRTAFVDDTSVASVIPISNDGPNSFPKQDGWASVAGEAREAVHAVFAEAQRGRRMIQPGTTGPIILLSKAALSMGGLPDVEGCGGNEEIAILEWGLRLSIRGWKHIQVADGYAASALPPQPPEQKVGLRFDARGYTAHIKTPMETFSQSDRANIEARLLRKQWNGLRPGVGGFDTGYESWKLLKAALRPLENTPMPKKGADIYIRHFGDNTESYIYGFGWIVFIDGTHSLVDGSHTYLRKLLADVKPTIKVVYADHETRVGDNFYPEFKGGLDVEMLMARDYITQACAIRVSALGQWPANRMELYDRVLEIALDDGADAFLHVPDVLITIDGPPTPESMALETLSRQMIVQNHLGSSAKVEAHKGLQGALVIKKSWKPACADAPHVSIIIPTLGSGRLIQPCVNTILQHTAYPNYSIILMHNGSRDWPELDAAGEDSRVHVVRWQKPFNWAALNNEAVMLHAKGEYLLFMNDDVTVSSLDGDWLDLLMGHAVLPDIGAVGAKLIHPMGVLQHIGVVAHKGVAGHLGKGLPNGHPGNNGSGIFTHEASAVTGACMLVSRAKFEQVGGFDEAFDINYNDTDFCLKLRQAGYRNVVEMNAELLHPEGTTRDSPATAKGMQKLIEDNVRFAEKWPQSDPYWNTNLALSLLPNKIMVAGLNCDILNWEDTLPDPAAERVLLINDLLGKDSQAFAEMQKGAVPLMADASGFAMQLIAPTPLNIGAWDIREPEAIASTLRTLGVDRIVLRSLVGLGGATPPVEFLRVLKKMGFPVSVAPVRNDVMTPWLDADWQEGAKPFGHVDVAAWKAALAALTGETLSEAAE